MMAQTNAEIGEMLRAHADLMEIAGENMFRVSAFRRAADAIRAHDRPLREPVAWYGPFVMNTEAEIRQAFEDFQRGVLGQVPRDHPLAPTNELAAETDSSLD